MQPLLAQLLLKKLQPKQTPLQLLNALPAAVPLKAAVQLHAKALLAVPLLAKALLAKQLAKALAVPLLAKLPKLSNAYA